jgi:hypothetical protein
MNGESLCGFAGSLGAFALAIPGKERQLGGCKPMRESMLDSGSRSACPE